MAFVNIDSSRYDVGKSTRKELFQDLVLNQSDLNTRVLDIEASSSKIIVFEGDVVFRVASSLTGIAMFTAASNFRLTGAVVGVYDKTGVTSGTLSIDVRKSTTRDFTTNVSIFTTAPSLNMATASNYDDSTNAVIDAGEQDMITGEALRLDITSIPSGLTGRIYVKVTGTPS